MVVTREIALSILDEIAAELAEEMGYDQISYNDINCGFWDMEHIGPLGLKEDGSSPMNWKKGTMSKLLKQKYGQMIEYKYHEQVPEGEVFRSTLVTGDYVNLRFMFGEPCLSIHKAGNTYMGELQIGRKFIKDEAGNAVLDKNGYHQYIDDYEIRGLHCFGELGISWGIDLHTRWINKIQNLEKTET